MPSHHRRGSSPPPLAYRPAPQYVSLQQLAPTTPSSSSHRAHGSGGSSGHAILETRTPSHHTASHPTRRPSVSGTRPSSHQPAAPPARRPSVSGGTRPSTHQTSATPTRRPSVSGTSRPAPPPSDPHDRGRGRGRAPAPPPPALANFSYGGGGSAQRGSSSHRGAMAAELAAGHGSSQRRRSTSRAPAPSPSHAPLHEHGSSHQRRRSTSRAPAASSSHAPVEHGSSHQRRRSTSRAPAAPSSSSSRAPASAHPAAGDTMLYTMGVEIETILFPQAGRPVALWKDRRATQATRDIAEFFNGQRAAAAAGRDGTAVCHEMVVQGDARLRGPDKYGYWALMRDASIGASGTAEEAAGVELVSPVLRFDAGGAWRRDVGRVFSTVGRGWEFRPTDTCGTHVHVRPRNGWNMQSLRALAKTIVYFEDAICDILPHHRVENTYCMRNYQHNWQFKTSRGDLQLVAAAYKRIDDCVDIDRLKALMNPRNRTLYEPGDPLYLRYFAWNFTNLDSSMKQTVEFRAPPKVTNPDDCRGWVEFAVNFVHAAIQSGKAGPSTARYSSDKRGLHYFLADNSMNGRSDVASWGRIVGSKSTSGGTSRPARGSSPLDRVEVLTLTQRGHWRSRFYQY